MCPKLKRISQYQNPLDWFLKQEELEQPRLEAIAHQFSEAPFDDHSLWLEIKVKLQKFRYPQPDAGSKKKTFYEILDRAGAVNVLSHPDTLRALWKCLLLEKIVAFDRELDDQRMASSGLTVKFHKKKALQIYGDLVTLERIAKAYDGPDLADELYDKVAREFRQHMRYAMQSGYKGSWAELLAGRSKKKPRNEARAVQVAIFHTLKASFQNLNVKRRLSDSFLSQLAELIWANPAINNLSTSQNLIKAISRSKSY